MTYQNAFTLNVTNIDSSNHFVVVSAIVETNFELKRLGFLRFKLERTFAVLNVYNFGIGVEKWYNYYIFNVDG